MAKRNSNRNNESAQSAMEYLMTYGWAILVIAVILAVLYQLGIFGGTSVTGTGCLASPGYLCEKIVMNTTGEVSFTFGQVSSQPITVTALGCSSTTTQPTMQAFGTPVVLQSSQVNSTAVQCPTTSTTFGAPFTGYLWIEYTTPSDSTPQISQIATFSATSSTSASIGPPPPPMLYVTDVSSAQVTVINTQTNQVVNTINLPSGSNPSGEVISPNGQYLYVAGSGYDEIFQIAIANDVIVKTITGLSSCIDRLQFASNGIVLYGSTGGCSPGYLDVINTQTDSIQPYSLPTISGSSSYFDFVISPASDTTLYYAPYFANVVITSSNAMLLASPAPGCGGYCSEIAASPDGQYVYSADLLGEPAHLFFISTSTYNLVTSTSLATNLPCSGDLIFEEPQAIAASGTTAYVSLTYLCSPEGSLYAIQTVDESTATITNTMSFGTTEVQRMAVSPNGQTLYAVSEPNSNVIAISTSNDQIIANIPVGSFPEWLVIG